jgi:feruloyl esterase
MTVKGKAITGVLRCRTEEVVLQLLLERRPPGAVEAQRFPEDYDGIISGAASHWTHLLGLAVSTCRQPQATRGYIPQAKLPAIQAAALAACEKLDAVEDGVVESPAECRFDPVTLLHGCESSSV